MLKLKSCSWLPVGPVGPRAPVAPVEPTIPGLPCIPWDPIGPVGPIGPGKPVPGSPVAPVMHIYMVKDPSASVLSTLCLYWCHLNIIVSVTCDSTFNLTWDVKVLTNYCILLCNEKKQ